MSACGAIGPWMVAILKGVYGRAKEVEKFLMSRQPALGHVVHDGGVVVLGYAIEHSVRGHGCRVLEQHPSSRQHPQPRRGSPIPTPAIRRTRRRASLSPLKGPSQERRVPVSEIVRLAAD